MNWVKKFGLVGLMVVSSWVQAKEVKIQYQGLTLNGDLRLAEGKTLQEGVVLFTHGTWMNQDYSTAKMLKQYLLPAGQNVLSISLNLSENDRHDTLMISCDRVHKHKHTDGVKEIQAWVKWLKAQGVEEIVLAGHSRGGNQTAWAASELNDDEAVRKVVLFAPALWDAEEQAAEYQAKSHRSLKPILEKAEALVKAGKGQTVLSHTDLLYCKDTQVTAESFADYYQQNPKMSTLNLLPKIKKPTLVFAGSEDTAVENLPEKIEPILSENPQLQLYLVEGSDHFFLDMSGEEAAEEMVKFIQE